MTSAFYEAGTLRQIANTLLLGWGYNFYRLENQLRADDQMVCAKAAWILGEAAKAISDAETTYRRVALAPPTRAKPFPDADALAKAQTLERLVASVVALASRLHSLPTPEQDLMTLRFRQEEDTLARLVVSDETLVGQAEILRQAVAGASAETLLAKLSHLEAGLIGLQDTLRTRQGLLM